METAPRGAIATLLQKLRQSSLWSICQIVGALVGFVGAVTGAWISWTSADDSKRQAEVAEIHAGAAKSAAEASQQMVLALLKQVEVTTKHLDQAVRLGNASESSANSLKQSAELVAKLLQHNVRGNLNHGGWEFHGFPSGNLSFRLSRFGGGPVYNIRVFLSNRILPAGVFDFKLSDACDGRPAYHIDDLPDVSFQAGLRGASLTTAEQEDVEKGVRRIVTYGHICYDDLVEKDKILQFCAYNVGMKAGPGSVELCSLPPRSRT